MKQANIILKLDKQTSFTKEGITPMEALLLVVEHQKNVGDHPVEVIPGTERDTTKTVHKEVEVEEDKIVTDAAGKKSVATVKHKATKEVQEPENRTNDQELARLRKKYGKAKVKAVFSEVRDLPTTFDDAIKKGMEIVAPSEDDLEEKESGVKTFKEHTGTEVSKATVPVTTPLAQTPVKK